MARSTSAWSKVAFLLSFGFLVGMFSAASCGGGGGGGSASAIQSSSSQFKIHQSTVGGSVPVGTSSFVVCRNVAFSPDGPNDTIVYLQATGLYSAPASATGTANLYLRIFDTNGNAIALVLPATAMTLPAGPATSVPFELLVPVSISSNVTAPQFPSASYTVQVIVASSASWSGTVSSTQIRIYTLNSPDVSAPSGNITG